MAKIIMGIDASTKSTGISIFEGTKLIHYECLTESSKNVYKRITNMVEKIIKVFKEYNPEDIIMEEVLPEDVRNNQQVFKALIYLQGLLVTKLNVEENFSNINFYVASHWRKECGIHTGKTRRREELKKDAMNKVKQEYSIEANDDICDAICIGWAYTHESIITDSGFEFK